MSDEDLEKHLIYAGDEMNALLDQLDADGFNTGAVLGGALTALLFRLVVQSPNGSTAIGMLSSAMHQAATIARAYDEEEGPSIEKVSDRICLGAQPLPIQHMQDRGICVE